MVVVVVGDRMLQELLPIDADHDLAVSVVFMCSCPRPFIEAISAS